MIKMECPKCGSENITDFVRGKVCLDCGINIDKYQARLDKVLSKFNKKSSGRRYFYNIELIIQIDYYVETNKFRCGGWNFETDCMEDFEISLKTVESILEDIE